MSVKQIFSVLIILVTVLNPAIAQDDARITPGTFGSIEARQIGPAVMSGRITAIDAINDNPRIIYVGTASGGIWKSITGGTLFKPIFDKHTQSIGALTIDQNNPGTIWVGTGESNMRNTVSVGTGLYKSEDEGSTWKKIGLDSTEHISKIVIHPQNGNIVYVAAPGPLWSDSKHRGLYKTYNSGLTWEKILYVDETTGCADIIIDPRNPDIVYASMWQFRRTPYSFSSGGPGSSLLKSYDGGQTWERIDRSFTNGDIGRICLALAPSAPDNIYAIVESKTTGLYRSTDAGNTWKRKSATNNVTFRPFYFSLIMVDPTDSNRIYRPGLTLSYSNDGGESFTDASYEGGWVHVDHHALWINPNNPQHLILGTDGGAYLSFDRGNNWLFLKNLPVSQFYHVDYDLEQPYNVYGGLQDNGSWKGPSNSPGGIKNRDWTSIGFGDGFWVHPDLTDNNIVYWQYQGGNLYRKNLKTNVSKEIKPYPGINDPELRFNWDTPMIPSRTNPNVFYTGSQFLYKTTNKGDSWVKLSPDLTTNDPLKQKQYESGGITIDNTSAENHCTIFAICESSLDEELIWAGTDDGNVQVTENGGDDWKNIVKNIPDLPPTTWCSSIEASNFDRKTAYVTFDGHRTGDMNVYVYKTTDLGKTWRSLATTDVHGYAWKIKEDLVNRNLLFLGTEFGLFISIDGGYKWAQFKENCPNVSVMDIVIHPQTHDLIFATHGRGIFIIDDLTALRNLNYKLINSDVALLPTRPAYVSSFGSSGYPVNAGEFVSQNPPNGAVITYYLKKRLVTGKLEIEIYDNENNLISKIPGTKRIGINRVVWDLRLKPPRVATGSKFEYSGFVGPYVADGIYNIKLVMGEKTLSGKIEIIPNPYEAYTKEDKDIHHSTVMKLYRMQEELAFINAQVMKAYDDTEKRKDDVKEENDLKASLNSFADKLKNFRATLVATSEVKGIVSEIQLRERIGSVYVSISSYPGRPTDSQIERTKGLEKEMKETKKKKKELLTKELKSINERLKKVGMTEVTLLTKEEFEEED
ncbi:MAG: glycosyl hydrolase [Ignavibacteria bacterium]|nr:glycosyl hydrolase [Ignavibacteria bacterium]